MTGTTSNMDQKWPKFFQRQPRRFCVACFSTLASIFWAHPQLSLHINFLRRRLCIGPHCGCIRLVWMYIDTVNLNIGNFIYAVYFWYFIHCVNYHYVYSWNLPLRIIQIARLHIFLCLCCDWSNQYNVVSNILIGATLFMCLPLIPPVVKGVVTW